MKNDQVIATAVAPVHEKASFLSEMVTQGLMWESVSILRKKNNWCQATMEDEYEGWVHDSYLSESHINSQDSLILTNRCTPLRSKRGRDSQVLALLSFATVVPLIEKTSGYWTIQLINGAEGFIPAQYMDVSNSRDNLISLATSLIGTPYLWGGKSSFGYDCSGFVQMVLKSVGVSFPRDASQQINFKNLEEISMEDSLPGDLVYFSENNRINHVAFIVEDGRILHSSGEVKLESIIEGKTRFNNKLAKLNHTFISLSGIIQE